VVGAVCGGLLVVVYGVLQRRLRVGVHAKATTLAQEGVTFEVRNRHPEFAVTLLDVEVGRPTDSWVIWRYEAVGALLNPPLVDATLKANTSKSFFLSRQELESELGVGALPGRVRVRLTIGGGRKRRSMGFRPLRRDGTWRGDS
jgi:hypothetical protein